MTQMIAHKEKRTYDRFPHEASLICSPFSTDIKYHAKKKNHSGGGMRIESKTPFRKGTILYIRMQDYLTEGLFPDAWEGFRMMAIAEVRWCQKINDEKGIHYDVGVKYRYPVYQRIVADGNR